MISTSFLLQEKALSRNHLKFILISTVNVIGCTSLPSQRYWDTSLLLRCHLQTMRDSRLHVCYDMQSCFCTVRLHATPATLFMSVHASYLHFLRMLWFISLWCLHLPCVAPANNTSSASLVWTKLSVYSATVQKCPV